MTETVTEEISGKVGHLYKQTPSWCAGKLWVKHREVSFKVTGYVRTGEPVTLRGKWVKTEKWGKQFDATEVVYTTPADPAGVKTWLEWYVPDVGPVKAQKMVDEFGVQLLELASQDPQAVAIFAGIPIESVNRIAREWGEFATRVSALCELSRLGLTQHQAETIYSRFKGSAVTILKEDPYLLLREVHGMGFKTVDELARKLGFPIDHPGRKRAAVITAVADALDEGSTVIEQAIAIGKACDLTELPEGEYFGSFEMQAADAAEKNLVKRMSGAGQWNLSIPAAYRHEAHLWQRLGESRELNPHTKGEIGSVDFKLLNLAHQYAKFSAGGQGYELDDDQIKAIYTAARYRFSFVTGGAGAGKTLVARAITKLFRDADIDVRLCAPTGKAARRLTEVIGREAMTIHRMLGYRPDGGFMHDQSNHLSSVVIIVDEASLIDSELWYHLFRACGRQTSIVAIGDPNQLPPVGAGSMLRDVIALDLAPVARLGHCHRQAGALKTNCNAILNGDVEPSVEGEPSPWMVHRSLTTPEHITKAVAKLFETYLPQWGYDPVSDTQFLTAKHAGQLGTTHLNKVCQRLRQKQLGEDLPEPAVGDDTRATLYPGDKVMHTRNNYQLDVMNGTQGVVITSAPSLVVQYDDREVVYPSEFKSEVQLAYVITPHKAQGSEWPCAVVICPKQHAFMQTRSWLYTAATRAKRTCVIIGDEDGVRRAAERVEVDRRTTCLQLFAKHEEARPA
jgi:exodeoxyribonuclease V alpha subunit